MVNKELLERLLNNPQIPIPPAIAVRVLERVGHPDCSLSEIRDILRHDPVLCGLILKTLNSVLYCFSHTVTSIDQALLLLGLSRVRSLVLTLYLPAVRNICRYSPHLRTFWKSSVIGAIVCRELSARLGRPDPESDLLAGLMRDIGKVILTQHYPNEYADLLLVCGNEPEAYLCEREVQWLEVSHADISAGLLQRWSLPESFTRAVACHHHPERIDRADRECAAQAELLAFASLASEFVINPQIPGLRRELLHRALTRFDMDETRLGEFLLPLNSKVAELGALLNVEVGEQMSYTSILSAASEELFRLTLQSSLDSIKEQQSKFRVEQQAEEWKQAAQRLREQSSRDPLTGLCNRSAFQTILGMELRRLRRRYSLLGIMYIDLDGFKPINDQFGHAFGDQVLKEVARALTSNLRQTDVVARIGGDEFAIIVPAGSERIFPLLSERLVKAIRKLELHFGRHLCSVGASVGIAYCLPYSGEHNAEQLIEAADKAMYVAKKTGKNRFSTVALLNNTDRETIESIERRTFRAFLIRRGLASEQQIHQTAGRRITPLCLQRIARRLGWITRAEAVELTRQQRTTHLHFCELVVQLGYLAAADLWTLLALQQEPPDHLAQRLIEAGMMGKREAAEELRAFYGMMGVTVGDSGMRHGSRSGTTTPTRGNSPSSAGITRHIPAYRAGPGSRPGL